MSTDPTLDLQHRMASLERALAEARDEIRLCRRSRVSVRTALAATVAAAGAMVGSNLGHALGSGQTVTAPFVVMDASGKEILSVTKDGSQARLQLRNPAGTSVVTLGSNSLNAGEIVISAMGGSKDIVLESRNNAADVKILDPTGTSRAELYKSAKGSSGLSVNDKSGALRAMCIANNDGHGQVSVHSAHGLGGLLADTNETNLRFYKYSQARPGEATTSNNVVLYLTDSDNTISKTRLPGLLLMNDAGKNLVQVLATEGGGVIKTAAGSTEVFSTRLESNALGGRLEIYGKDDSKSPVFVAEGGGAFIFSANGTPVLGLTRGVYGGKLIIGNQSGDATVEAGTLDNGRGVVRAYPLGGPTPIPIPNLITGWGGPH